MSEFIDLLDELLSVTDVMNKDDVTRAQELIKARFVELNQVKQGQCVNCHAPFIIRSFSTTHTKKGEAWYEAFFKKWNRPATTGYTGGTPTFNNYSWTTVKHYVCGECVTELEELTERAKEEAAVKNHNARRAKYDKDTRILSGELHGTPAKRYWILRERLTEKDTELLRAMPYKDFLNSIYWDIVRTYVRYRQGNTCELCNSIQNLQVHHRTYEHRGEEVRFLSDLVLLCRACHAKFHDKLATE